MPVIKKLDAALAGDDMRAFTFQLMNRPLFLPDIYRHYQTLTQKITELLKTSPELWGFYAGPELVAVAGVMNIQQSHDARFLFWAWDKRALTRDSVKWLGEYLDWIMDCFQLSRVTVQTPCENLARLCRLLGFKTEGRFARGFKHGGKLYTLLQLRKLREG